MTYDPFGRERAPRNRPHLMLGTPLSACLRCNGQGYGRHESTCPAADQEWSIDLRAFDRLRPVTITGDPLEVALSKSTAAWVDKPGMTAFLADLSRWAERMMTRGYTIVAEPDEGPGTMRWRAVR